MLPGAPKSLRRQQGTWGHSFLKLPAHQKAKATLSVVPTTDSPSPASCLTLSPAGWCGSRTAPPGAPQPCPRACQRAQRPAHQQVPRGWESSASSAAIPCRQAQPPAGVACLPVLLCQEPRGRVTCPIAAATCTGTQPTLPTGGSSMPWHPAGSATTRLHVALPCHKLLQLPVDPGKVKAPCRSTRSALGLHPLLLQPLLLACQAERVLTRLVKA